MKEPVHYMIGFSGFAGVGKDECAKALILNHNGIQTGLADPAKRHVGELYGFTKDQLFGPSELRNQVDPELGFSCRTALQEYMEFMQRLYLKTWIRKGVNTQKALAEFKMNPNGGYCLPKGYDRANGIFTKNSPDQIPTKTPIVTVFSDIRWPHDVEGITEAKMKKGSLSIVVRIKRDSIPEPPYDHPSETRQLEVPDENFHYIIRNNSDLETLHDKANFIVETLKKGQVPSSTVTL
jgi:hypothetical protein